MSEVQSGIDSPYTQIKIPGRSLHVFFRPVSLGVPDLSDKILQRQASLTLQTKPGRRNLHRFILRSENKTRKRREPLEIAPLSEPLHQKRCHQKKQSYFKGFKGNLDMAGRVNKSRLNNASTQPRATLVAEISIFENRKNYRFLAGFPAFAGAAFAGLTAFAGGFTVFA